LSSKSADGDAFGEVRLTDGDLETGEEFYVHSFDGLGKRVGVLIVQAAERNPEYPREKDPDVPRRIDFTSIDDAMIMTTPPPSSLSPRAELKRYSQPAPSSSVQPRKRSLVQEVALETQNRFNARSTSISSGSSSRTESGSSQLVSSGSAARRRRGLKPLLRAAASFREFQVSIRIWDGKHMREQDSSGTAPESISHDLVLFVASGEPIQHFIPPLPVRIITLSWNQSAMNMQNVWYFSFEIVIIWYATSWLLAHFFFIF
jgi:hypothetical protein